MSDRFKQLALGRLHGKANTRSVHRSRNPERKPRGWVGAKKIGNHTARKVLAVEVRTMVVEKQTTTSAEPKAQAVAWTGRFHF